MTCVQGHCERVLLSFEIIRDKRTSTESIITSYLSILDILRVASDCEQERNIRDEFKYAIECIIKRVSKKLIIINLL